MRSVEAVAPTASGARVTYARAGRRRVVREPSPRPRTRVQIASRAVGDGNLRLEIAYAGAIAEASRERGGSAILELRDPAGRRCSPMAGCRLTTPTDARSAASSRSKAIASCCTCSRRSALSDRNRSFGLGARREGPEPRAVRAVRRRGRSRSDDARRRRTRRAKRGQLERRRGLRAHARVARRTLDTASAAPQHHRRRTVRRLLRQLGRHLRRHARRHEHVRAGPLRLRLRAVGQHMDRGRYPARERVRNRFRNEPLQSTPPPEYVVGAPAAYGGSTAPGLAYGSSAVVHRGRSRFACRSTPPTRRLRSGPRSRSRTTRWSSERDRLDRGRVRDRRRVGVRSESGASWSLQSKLVGADTASDDAFGSAVAIEGDTVLIGAPDAGGSSGRTARPTSSRAPARRGHNKRGSPNVRSPDTTHSAPRSPSPPTPRRSRRSRPRATTATPRCTCSSASDRPGRSRTPSPSRRTRSRSADRSRSMASASCRRARRARRSRDRYADHGRRRLRLHLRARQRRACTANAECVSTHCVDSVCCDSGCASTCYACSSAKKGAGSTWRDAHRSATASIPTQSVLRRCASPRAPARESATGAARAGHGLASRAATTRARRPRPCAARPARPTPSARPPRIASPGHASRRRHRRPPAGAIASARAAIAPTLSAATRRAGRVASRASRRRRGAAPTASAARSTAVIPTRSARGRSAPRACKRTVTSATAPARAGSPPRPNAVRSRATARAWRAPSCASDADCVASGYCEAGKCLAKMANGAVCTGGRECASAVCADGVCCDSRPARAVSGVRRRGLPRRVLAGGRPTARRPRGLRRERQRVRRAVRRCRGRWLRVPEGWGGPCSANACKAGIVTHSSICDGRGSCAMTGRRPPAARTRAIWCRARSAASATGTARPATSASSVRVCRSTGSARRARTRRRARRGSAPTASAAGSRPATRAFRAGSGGRWALARRASDRRARRGSSAARVSASTRSAATRPAMDSARRATWWGARVGAPRGRARPRVPDPHARTAAAIPARRRRATACPITRRAARRSWDRRSRARRPKCEDGSFFASATCGGGACQAARPRVRRGGLRRDARMPERLHGRRRVRHELPL